MIFMKKVTQVALDLTDFEDALKIAREAVLGGIDWLEAGTPLIKSEGISAVEKLRQEFPEKKIVADMKTTDTGRLEVKLAGGAGADMVSVFGACSDETIKKAVEAGDDYDVEIVADLMAVGKPIERAQEVEALGVDYIGIHTGIDQQMSGESPLKHISPVVESTSLPIAVAGGLDINTIPEAIERGASILIVGKYITKAKDPKKASKRIAKCVEEYK